MFYEVEKKKIFFAVRKVNFLFVLNSYKTCSSKRGLFMQEGYFKWTACLFETPLVAQQLIVGVVHNTGVPLFFEKNKISWFISHIMLCYSLKVYARVCLDNPRNCFSTHIYIYLSSFYVDKQTQETRIIKSFLW